MTTSLFNYSSQIYTTTPTDTYSGVVKIGYDDRHGTASLLYDGRTILTSAHLFSYTDYNSTTITINSITYKASVDIYDDIDTLNSNGDIALVTLDENISTIYQRYQLYKQTNEIGKVFDAIGYGERGSGEIGAYISNTNNTKVHVQNTFDTDMHTLNNSPMSNFSWESIPDNILVADFDDGTSSNDTIGLLTSTTHTGIGDMEGLIAAGDSGGPAFIDNKIAGVANYTFNIDTKNNSDFGDLAAWQRVSYYQEWIDKTIRANYQDAPTSKEEVQLQVEEGDDTQIAYAYFLLQYTQDRTLVYDNITLSYTTKDGTAIANEDYIPTSGTITLYEDETQVLIPVEIIGDNIQENDEIFYLEVSNPSHGNLGADTITLTATRTIIDDDGYIA